MDPHERFCHNRACWAYGRAGGEGHIVIHSQKERRYRCERCGRTFPATKGTALYRTHKPRDPLTTPRRDLDGLRVPGAGHRRRLLSLSTNAPSIAGS